MLYNVGPNLHSNAFDFHNVSPTHCFSTLCGSRPLLGVPFCSTFCANKSYLKKASKILNFKYLLNFTSVSATVGFATAKPTVALTDVKLQFCNRLKEIFCNRKTNIEIRGLVFD